MVDYLFFADSTGFTFGEASRNKIKFFSTVFAFGQILWLLAIRLGRIERSRIENK